MTACQTLLYRRSSHRLTVNHLSDVVGIDSKQVKGGFESKQCERLRKEMASAPPVLTDFIKHEGHVGKVPGAAIHVPRKTARMNSRYSINCWDSAPLSLMTLETTIPPSAMAESMSARWSRSTAMRGG